MSELSCVIANTLKTIFYIWPWHDQPRGPFHERFFHHSSNSVEISFSSYPSYSEMIAMKFCTWHNSCAVMASTTFHSITIPYDGLTLIVIFYRIWSQIGKLLVKWAPAQHFYPIYCITSFAMQIPLSKWLPALMQIWGPSGQKLLEWIIHLLNPQVLFFSFLWISLFKWISCWPTAHSSHNRPVNPERGSISAFWRQQLRE